MKRDGLRLVDMNDDQRALYFDAVSRLLREGQVPDNLLAAFFPNAQLDRSTLTFSFECVRGVTTVALEEEFAPREQPSTQHIDGWRVHFEYGRVGENGAMSGFQMAAKAGG